MVTRADLKNEWLRFSGLDYSDDDRWLRDIVAPLFDLEEPNEDQQRLLSMANIHVALIDLPAGAARGHKNEISKSWPTNWERRVWHSRSYRTPAPT